MPYRIDTADFDGDGVLDLVVPDTGGWFIGVYLGVGDGTFDREYRFMAGSAPISLAIADLDGDGDPDLAASNSCIPFTYFSLCPAEIHVLINNAIPPAECPADLTGEGVLNFDDVAVFLVAFGAHDAAVDLTFPLGVFDFSDVFAFLTAFGAGCP